MKLSHSLAAPSRYSAARVFSSTARCRPQHSSRRTGLHIVAFKESDDIKDWRVKKMVDMSHKFFADLWSKGDLHIADTLLDSNVVYRDNSWVWKSTKQGTTIGVKAFKAMVAETRKQYPDLWFEVEQVGVSDTNHIFVQWTGHGTNLESVKDHAATYHQSNYSGVDLIGFNEDRSKIIEVTVFREPTSEEKWDMERRTPGNPLEMKLARLHW